MAWVKGIKCFMELINITWWMTSHTLLGVKGGGGMLSVQIGTNPLETWPNIW